MLIVCCFIVNSKWTIPLKLQYKFRKIKIEFSLSGFSIEYKWISQKKINPNWYHNVATENFRANNSLVVFIENYVVWLTFETTYKWRNNKLWHLNQNRIVMNYFIFSIKK